LNYKGVLFDLDGVLLKSMEQHLEAWKDSFRHFKVTITEEEFYQLEGRGVQSVVETLVDRHNIDPRYKDQIVQHKIKYYNNIFKPIFYNGIFTFLDDLKKREIKMAVVTGGMRDRVDEIIKDHFREYFSASITSDDVENTKPYPEPYLKGAATLGLDPSECVVIENAPLGIKAGKEAGMFVIAISTTMDKFFLKEADHIVATFDEMNQYLLMG